MDHDEPPRIIYMLCSAALLFVVAFERAGVPGRPHADRESRGVGPEESVGGM